MILRYLTTQVPAANIAATSMAILVTSGLAGTAATIPERVPTVDFSKAPYRFTGTVTSNNERGSGVCVWNSKTFLSSANVVFGGDKWAPAPVWAGLPSQPKSPRPTSVRTRGYYRWADYSDLIELNKRNAAFGRDLILGFAFEPLISGQPGSLHLGGYRDLLKPVTTVVTGFTDRDPADGQPLGSSTLFQTEPAVNPFQNLSGFALSTPRIAGNDEFLGSPVWIRGSGNRWLAAGLLVGGIPGESVVCGFSPEIKSLQRAVAPVIATKQKRSIALRNVEASSMFFPYTRRHGLADGSNKWTNFKVGVKGFPKDATIGSMKLSLQMTTSHRGDLHVILTGPGGVEAVIHSGEGGDLRDLVFEDRDLSAFFAGVRPNGTWILRARDAVKGDTATLESFRLEISAAQ